MPENESLEKRGLAVEFRDMTARWITPPSLVTNLHTKTLCVTEKNEELVPVLAQPTWNISPTLRNINAEFAKGKLIGIVGPIGSGKSSLLQALLRELPLESGAVCINGSVSYACQEPWVFAGSVRQNILFGEEMDRNRYDMVVKSCALEKDFEQLEFEDRTLVGERGASLSGGQKARIK